MAWLAKMLPATSGLHVGLVLLLAVPLLIQLPTNLSGSPMEDGPSAWESQMMLLAATGPSTLLL